MRVFDGGLRIAFLCFFASHIPITICIDGQAALSKFYPQFLRDFVAWYCDLFGDVLMRGPYEAWFSSIVTIELLFQLPFFFIAVLMLWQYPSDKNSAETYPRWFQKACLVYGSHVATTLVPIIGTFLTSPEMTRVQKVVTLSVYSPYLIFPVLMIGYALEDEKGSSEAGDTGSKKQI